MTLTRWSWPLICLALIVSLSPAAMADEHVIRRAALDIGSANIKCTVADVDTTSCDVVRIVDEFSLKTDFAEDMARSYDGNFSHAIMDQGMEAIRHLKEKALALGAKEFSAVGGNPFREARNGRAYFTTLKERLGIPCRILSKQQAALLSYHAVRLVIDIPPMELLVWDIGGSSQTMTSRTREGGLSFYIDKTASVSFKNTVIANIQGKNINAVSTPNPMSPDDTARALELATSHALINVSPDLASRFNAGTLRVVGIGGVHYYAVPELIGQRGKTYTKKQIETAITNWTGKPDPAFESDYASTRLTNLILVLGYMNALNVDVITPLKVNESLGLLVSPEFW